MFMLHSINCLGLLQGKHISIAAQNGPNQFVLSGKSEKIETIYAKLKQNGFLCAVVNTKVAYHSSLMNSLAGKFRDDLSKYFEKKTLVTSPQSIASSKNRTGFFRSCFRKGEVVSASDLTEEFWTRHLCDTIHFYSALQQFASIPIDGRSFEMLEVGFDCGLARHVESFSNSENVPITFRSVLPFPERVLAQMWTRGLEVDWADHQNRMHTATDGAKEDALQDCYVRVALPLYPFDRTVCSASNNFASPIEKRSSGISVHPTSPVPQITTPKPKNTIGEGLTNFCRNIEAKIAVVVGVGSAFSESQCYGEQKFEALGRSRLRLEEKKFPLGCVSKIFLLKTAYDLIQSQQLHLGMVNFYCCGCLTPRSINCFYPSG
jgi:acyl transferase domain-containing protein